MTTNPYEVCEHDPDEPRKLSYFVSLSRLIWLVKEFVVGLILCLVILVVLMIVGYVVIFVYSD